MGLDDFVVVGHLDFHEDGVGDAHCAHDEEKDGEEVDGSAHGGRLHQFNAFCDFESADVIIVGHHQVVLSFLQRLGDAAPQLVFSDQGLVLGPFVEMLVFDADPLLVVAALLGSE